ncbi:MAG: hypothetical protein MHMPM18_001319 [Marteilia pararefringens]
MSDSIANIEAKTEMLDVLMKEMEELLKSTEVLMNEKEELMKSTREELESLRILIERQDDNPEMMIISNEEIDKWFDKIDNLEKEIEEKGAQCADLTKLIDRKFELIEQEKGSQGNDHPENSEI